MEKWGTQSQVHVATRGAGFKFHQSNVCVQKLLVSHPYKNVMMFGGCKQDFMLVVDQNVGSSKTKDRSTVKHLFAMDASEVSDATRPIDSHLLCLQ